MDKRIRMVNNNGLLPVYQLVLKRLTELNKPFLYNRDFENVILNMRFKKKDLDLRGIKKELAVLGFTRINIDKICNHVLWKMRYTLGDAYEIKKTLVKKGFLKISSGNRIYIKNQE